MAKKFSTGLRNALLGARPSTGSVTSIAHVVAGNTITDTGNGLLIFMPGDVVKVLGSSDALNNIFRTLVTVDVAGGTMTVADAVQVDPAGDAVTIQLTRGRSFKDCFTGGILEIYSGAQPADADQAETGTKLLRISVGSGAVVPGVLTNGLSWLAAGPSAGVLAKAAEVWSGVGLSNGVAGWFRFYTNMYKTGGSVTAIRFDGSVGTSGAQLNMSNTNIVLNATTTIDSFNMTMAV